MASAERLNPNRSASRCAAASALRVGDINWCAPWLADWRAVGEPMARQVAWGCPQHQALNAAQCAPVRFVPQDDLPEGQAYEDFIFATRQVPTREGLHDFFNALCWMHFPLAKKRLNQLQAQEIARAGVGQVRGKVRDAATVFDENALLVQPSDALWEALTDHRWADALLGLRSEWAHTRVWAFGHAALEKAVQPYKSITVHMWRVPQGVPPQDIDAWLAQDLTETKLSQKPFSPLPMLGLPGWWPDNKNPSFYADPTVFRPKRRSTPNEKPHADQDYEALS
ncbi:DUF3025 domain-containing protein [Limnohabitans sp. Rim8]|uniref:DUF3025 domain-containing protein n=1 Tax=Limnohabitans sp. Rim8 TaxID=1100718 RepID=UPI00341610E8